MPHVAPRRRTSPSVLASTPLVRFAKLRRAPLVAGILRVAIAVLAVPVPSVRAWVPALRRGAQPSHDAVCEIGKA